MTAYYLEITICYEIVIMIQHYVYITFVLVVQHYVLSMMLFQPIVGDLQVDLIKFSTLPVLKRFLGTDEGLQLKV